MAKSDGNEDWPRTNQTEPDEALQTYVRRWNVYEKVPFVRRRDRGGVGHGGAQFVTAQLMFNQLCCAFIFVEPVGKWLKSPADADFYLNSRVLAWQWLPKRQQR